MSPAALLRTCAFPGGCPELVASGMCQAHTRQAEQRRGSAHSRGYGRRWFAFRDRFISLLIEADITPSCGARLPEGPDTQRWSRCAQDGRLTTARLHLDHEPPLTEDERGDHRAVCNAQRVSFLCRDCHQAKTQAQTRGRA